MPGTALLPRQLNIRIRSAEGKPISPPLILPFLAVCLFYLR